MRKVTSKKDYPYVVETNDDESKVKKVRDFVSPSSQVESKWEYFVCYDSEEYDIEYKLNKAQLMLPIISFETWQVLPDYEPKEVAVSQSKKIVGYKLVKEEYKEACKEILKQSNEIHSNYYNSRFEENVEDYGINFDNSGAAFKCFRKSGVLDLWFEPVYEESTETKIMDYLAEQGIEINEECASVIIKIVNNK